MVLFVNILSNLPILVGTSLVNFLTKVVTAFLLIVAGSGVTSSTALTNDEILNVTIDSAKLLELDADSSVVQIGNPAIADVIVNPPKSIFVMGRGDASKFNFKGINSPNKSVILRVPVKLTPPTSIMDRFPSILNWSGLGLERWN